MAITNTVRRHINPIKIVTWGILLLLTAFLVAVMLSVHRLVWSTGWTHPSPITRTMPEGDLASLWMAGHLARLGQLDWLYDSRLFEAWRHQRFGMLLRSQPWIYPPTVLLLGVPISFLPLGAAFLLWNVTTLGAAVLLLRHARLPWSILLLGLSAPATWYSWINGQYGTITGALVVAGLLLAPTRPMRAGIMLGLTTLKPQQGMIVPIAWLAARNWRAIGMAAAAFAVLALLVMACFGHHAWVLFATRSNVSVRELLEAPLPQDNINTGVSVFWMARTMGSGVPAAYVLQGVAILAATLFAYRAWRLPDADPLARMAVTVCLSLLVTPYGYTSDMVAYSIAVAAVVAGNCWRLRLIDGLLWLWPGYCPIITLTTGYLFTPFFIVTATVLAWRQMVPRRNPVTDGRGAAIARRSVPGGRQPANVTRESGRVEALPRA